MKPRSRRRPPRRRAARRLMRGPIGVSAGGQRGCDEGGGAAPQVPEADGEIGQGGFSQQWIPHEGIDG